MLPANNHIFLLLGMLIHQLRNIVSKDIDKNISAKISLTNYISKHADAKKSEYRPFIIVIMSLAFRIY